MKSLLIVNLFIVNIFFASSLWAENDLSEQKRKSLVLELVIRGPNPGGGIKEFFRQNPQFDLANVVTPDGMTHLHIAMLELAERPEDLVEAIEALYEYSNIDPNAQFGKNKIAALHLAFRMRRGSKSVIRALYKHPDLDPNIRAAREKTALHLVFGFLNWSPIESIEGLFEHPNIQINPRDIMGSTPLDMLEGPQPRPPGIEEKIKALWQAKEQEAKALCYVN